eukprot:m51a1_g13280 hypothetical protein (107) ;mRNA; r:26-407
MQTSVNGVGRSGCSIEQRMSARSVRSGRARFLGAVQGSAEAATAPPPMAKCVTAQSGAAETAAGLSSAMTSVPPGVRTAARLSVTATVAAFFVPSGMARSASPRRR